MKLGGLLKNLELKINATDQIMNEYEMKCNQLLTENTYLNQSYINTFEIDYNLCTTQDLKYLQDYRDSLFTSILSNNGEIIYLNNCINKQQQIKELFIKCYEIINKCN